MSALVSVWRRPLPVDRVRLDQPLARLDAVGAGVHAERAADRAGDAVEEGEAAEPLLQREGGEALVGQRRAGADAVARLAHRLAEALGRQADDDAGDAAVADEEVRADADDGDRHCRIELRRNSARSSASAGWNRSSAGPPTRNQVNGASVGVRA